MKVFDRYFRRNKSSGFTIVELLIVIIVIGILATLVLVAYANVSDQAKASAAKNDLEQLAKQINTYRENTGGGSTYPADASSLPYSSGTTVQYSVNNTVSPATYCITAVNGSAAYYVSSTSGTPTAGYCSDTGADTIGWWKFNGNANDSSPTGANGTVSGATLATGQNGSANSAYQTGDSMSISIGKPAAFNNLATSGLTYTLWAKRTGVSTATQWPSMMGGDGHTNIVIRSSGYGANPYVEYGRSPYDGSAFSQAGSVNNIPTGEWHMWSVTYGSNLFSFYEDGKLVGSSANPINPNTGSVGFGWPGVIDDARVYNRPLSANELASLYSKGAQ